MEYNIRFIGKDYQPLSEAVKNAEIWPEEPTLDIKHLPMILPMILIKVLDKAQDRIISGKLAVNGSKNRRRNDNSIRKIYDPYFGEAGNSGYFCGIVGVVHEQLKSRDIIDISDAESDQCTNDSTDNSEDIYNVTLEIRSRLDITSNEGQDKEPGKPFFLSTMLLNGRIDLSNCPVPDNEDEIFDYLLLAQFKEQLQKAYLKGYYRTYRRFENNDDRLKGAIDVNRHIKLNMVQKNGRIAYSFRANTINNYLNKLIVIAYKYIKNKYPELVYQNFDNDPELKRIVDFLINETGYEQEDAAFIISKNTRRIVHPYYSEYDDLRVTCLRILRNEGLSIFDADMDNNTDTILFYLPDLWEDFLATKLLDKSEAKYGAQEEIDIFERSNKFIQGTRPDFVFFKDEKPFMILDAKFKPGWNRVHSGNDSLSEAKVLDDYDKCIRDMVSINGRAAGVIFPVNIKNNNTGENDIENKCSHAISDYNTDSVFYTIPVFIPYAPGKDEDISYEKWKEEFEEQVKKCSGQIQEIYKTNSDRFLTDETKEGIIYERTHNLSLRCKRQ